MRRDVVTRAVKVGVIVGTILTAITRTLTRGYSFPSWLVELAD